MVWFAKIPVISQPILSFPVIGFISLYQSLIIFGFGVPSLFVTMHVTQELFYGIIPFLGFVVFSLIRPPLISYEGRLFVLLKWYIMGKKQNISKSSKLKIPSSVIKAKKSLKPKPKVPIENITVPIRDNKLIEVSITLRNRDGHILPKKHVRIILDDTPIRTEMSSSLGEVSVILENEDCFGTRTISVAEIKDGKTGGTILKRVITFARNH